MHATNVWWTSKGYDMNARKASTRHLGGVNLGFLDGHATWINSERLMAMGAEGEFEYPNTTVWCVPTVRSQYEEYCGGPPDPGMVFLY
jgi:prepilin-type processing-associated H-X9-DG protein